MAKEAGMGDNFYIGGYNLSTDVSALDTIACRRAALDVTSIDKSAVERISGLLDGEMSFATWFDAATDLEHAALSTLPTTDRTCLYFHGSTVGNQSAGLNGKQINYDWSRGQDGSLAGTVQVLGIGSPVDWGIMLTAGPELFASSGAGTHFDQTTASTTFGAVAYLQVFSLSGTSVTVAIQDSVDTTPGNFSNITGLAFTAVTPGRGEQRLATAVGATIRRWVRVNLTGTFTNATIAVSFTRFPVAQS
jgi:hypothetical protein